MNKITNTITPVGNRQKEKHALNHNPGKTPGTNGKPTARASVTNNHVSDELTKFRLALAELQRIQNEAKRELQLVRRIRFEAERCQQGIEAKARSQAQMFLLQTRLATQKEIAGIKGNYGEQIQKLLVDVRMIRITAQEELETQRKFTDAARIRALSFACQADTEQILKTKEEAISA